VQRQLGLRRESQQPLSLDRDTDEWEKEGDWVASADADVDMAVDIARALSTLEPWERAFLVHWFYEGVPAREAAHLAGTTYA
ncbi:hypothetical protein, partial [Escherichia coli]|uniref:hypothetical protein n=1 Tax=Escherichia coli TaxID=562 RepID=UPI003CE4BE70